MAGIIFFQGTDDTVWHVNSDGSGGAKFGGYKSGSMPVVFGSKVYFQGTDNKLWQVNTDATGGIVLGNNTTSAPPFVTSTGVYFRGTDNQLWRIGLDGQGQYNVGNGNTTSSTPFVLGQYLFFRGTDDKLWRIGIDGSQQQNIGAFKCASNPVATRDYVFFQGTDDKLWRCNLDGSGGNNLQGYKTSSAPCVTSSALYFQGTDDKLWKTNLDGTAGTNLGGYKCKSSPVVDETAGYVYFQGTDNTLWRINTDGSNGVKLGGFATNSTPYPVWSGNQPVQGSGPLSHIVLMLTYAPPGSKVAKEGCTVTYSDTISTGTTFSIGDSFNYQLGVTVSPPSGSSGSSGSSGGSSGSGSSGSSGGGSSGGSGGGAGAGSQLGLTYSNTSGSTATVTVTVTDTEILQIPSPPQDGINHDYDRVFILLKPTMDVIVDRNANLDWGLDIATNNGGVVYLQMNWLRDLNLFKTEQPDFYNRCQAAGMTAADYASLLALNPAANGVTTFNLPRYTPVNFNFDLPFDPPPTLADQGSTVVGTYEVGNTVTNSVTTTSETDWTASLTAVIPGLSDVLKVTGSVKFTSTSSKTSSVTQTQTATITVGAPSFGYTGPTRMFTYLDTIFNTYAFALTDDMQPSMTGILKDASGNVLANAEAMLTVGGKEYYAVTDAKGQYQFYGTPPGQGTVTAAPTLKTIGSGGIKGIVGKLPIVGTPIVKAPIGVVAAKETVGKT